METKLIKLLVITNKCTRQEATQAAPQSWNTRPIWSPYAHFALDTVATCDKLKLWTNLLQLHLNASKCVTRENKIERFTRCLTASKPLNQLRKINLRQNQKVLRVLVPTQSKKKGNGSWVCKLLAKPKIWKHDRSKNSTFLIWSRGWARRTI